MIMYLNEHLTILRKNQGKLGKISLENLESQAVWSFSEKLGKVEELIKIWKKPEKSENF